MEKLYYSISEVASIVGENTTTVRFWTNTFAKYISPKRNAKGNRLYRTEDLELLRRVHQLTREGGLSLEAVERKLGNPGSDEDKAMQVRDILVSIKAQLEEIRKTL